MYIFKLFENDIQQAPIDARLLQDGLLRIGRDPHADWVVNDLNCEVSRWHCEFEVVADRLILRCMGANGVFDGDTRERFLQDTDIAVTVPRRVEFGSFILAVDHAVQDDGMINAGQTLIFSPPFGSTIAVPTEWTDQLPPPEERARTSLLDAFCEGAGLNASSFASEDPEIIMRRAGAVYRQMVLGIGDLMSEREKMRGQFQLARTTIGGTNNNPFKWAPTQRLAIDLLLANDRGFLSGADALGASFRDIKKHLIATFEGMRASMRAAISRFNPSDLDKAAVDQAVMLKSRATTRWEIGCARYDDLVEQLDRGTDGLLNQTFVKTYERSASDLEAGKI